MFGFEQESAELAILETSRQFIPADVIPTDQELQKQIQQKTLELLTRSGNSGSFSLELSRIESILKEQAKYFQKLGGLKEAILKTLTEEKLDNAGKNTREAAREIIAKAKEPNISLCQLMAQVTLFISKATADVGYVWGRVNRPLEDMQGLLTEFNLDTLLRSWEDDITQLSNKTDKIQKEQQMRNTILTAASMVLKEENYKLNRTIADLNESMQQSMNQSTIYDHGGEEVRLEELKNAKSLSSSLAKNNKLVTLQVKKTQELEKQHSKMAIPEISARLQQYMSPKSVYAIYKVSERQRQITEILNLLSPNKFNTARKFRGDSSLFGTQTGVKSLEIQMIDNFKQELEIINRLINVLVKNDQSENTSQILNDAFQNLGRLDTELKSTLSTLIEDKKSDMFPANADKIQKYRFIQNLFQLGVFVPKNDEMFEALNQEMKSLSAQVKQAKK